MITFNTPENLNGAQLRDELNGGGVKISDNKNSVCVNGEGQLELDIKASDEAKAVEIVAKHIGVNIDTNAIKASAQTKLAALGLTEEEVSSILG